MATDTIFPLGVTASQSKFGKPLDQAEDTGGLSTSGWPGEQEVLDGGAGIAVHPKGKGP
jgi:hypothetical protein